MNERLGFVVSDFNADMTHMMCKIAEEHTKFLGAKVEKIIRVPGAFDMPIAVKKLLEMKNIDSVVTLGAVIQGDSDHDITVAGVSAKKIADLAVEFSKPVSLGVSGPRMSRADGVKRIEGYAKRAVESSVKLLRRLK
ncbi:6,7-dimethyl-8-ribityllumazine synthase [Candidatus Woesearchaeota archaeon]|jgi:6,7-dimethyl-8-ribityllumazine synthase|nr:6,7-dimethyl-8-ribityllumazine synthase [Candidatus Woesearchaeota archaeon]